MAVSPPSWWTIFKERSQLEPEPKKGGGGGGKSRVQLGHTGPRGRHFPVVKVPMRHSVIIKSKFIANNKNASKRLGVWINYQVNDKHLEKEKAERERESDPAGKVERHDDDSREEPRPGGDDQAKKLEPHQGRDDRAEDGRPSLPSEMLREKSFFTQDRDDLTPEEAKKLIEDNFGTKVAYHQMILSPGENIVDPKEYARAQIETLEERLGHEITCVMNVHRDTDNTHINVTIAGRIPDWKPPQREQEDAQEGPRPYTSEQIDIERLEEKDRMEATDGLTYTKYHSKEELLKLEGWLRGDESRWLDYDDYTSKLWHWINSKEERGENCFGVPPLRERVIDREKIPEADRLKSGDEFVSKYDSIETLQKFAERELSDEEKSRLDEWIKTKQERAEEAYGEPLPNNYREQQEQQEKKPHELFGKLTLDLSKVPEEERIDANGRLYTKYNSTESLKELKNNCFEEPDGRLPKEQYEMLKGWISDKQEQGEDCYGQAPMRQMTAEEVKERAESLESKLRDSIEDRKSRTLDEIARDLTGGRTVSPEVVAIDRVIARAERNMEREERQIALKSSWNDRGDVYLDRKSLDGMRVEGNYFIHGRLNPERELDRAIDREFGREDRGREHSRDDEITRVHQSQTTTVEEPPAARDSSDDSRSRADREERDDDEERKGRRSDDEFGRGNM